MLLCFVLSFTNCVKDDVIIQTETLETNLNKPILKNISFEEFSKNVLAKESFTNVSKSNIIRETKNSINHRSQEEFEIETTNVIYMESADGLYHSYTFYVTNTEANSGLENVFFSLQEDGSYKTFLVFYDITDEEIAQMKLGHQVSVSNKWSFTEITENQIINPNAKVFFDSSTGCWKRETFYPAATCNGQDSNGEALLHNYSQYNQCNASVKPTQATIVVSTITCNVTGQGTDPSGGLEPGNSPDTYGNGSTGDSTAINFNSVAPPDTTEIDSCIDADAIANLVSVLSLSPQIESCLSQTDSETCNKVSQLNANVTPLKSTSSSYASKISFAKAAASAICNGGEVDYENGIIYDGSFNNYECQKNIIKQITEVAEPLSELLQEIFVNTNDAQLTFHTESLPSIFLGGYTYYSGANDNGLLFNITLNLDRLTNSTNLDLISNSVHEYTHAILLYFFYASPNFNIDLANPPSYVSLIQMFSMHREAIGTTNETQHTYMINLVSNMAQVCFNWCQQNSINVTLEQMTKICWGGLEDTASFDVLFPLNTMERQAILNASQSEILPNSPGESPLGTLPCQ